MPVESRTYKVLECGLSPSSCSTSRQLVGEGYQFVKRQKTVAELYGKVRVFPALLKLSKILLHPGTTVSFIQTRFFTDFSQKNHALGHLLTAKFVILRA